jgi:hypothetical protein
LPALDEQVDRLLTLGLHRRAGLTAAELQEAARGAPEVPDAAGPPLLAVDPTLLPASMLAPHLDLAGKSGSSSRT